MQRFAIFFLLFFVLFANVKGQETSNKGKLFWVGFMDHIDASGADMDLYITSDSNTTGTVSVPGQAWSTTFSITANQMTLVPVPSNKAYMGCSDCIEDKGIKITSIKPVVVYSHIHHSARSDATLVLPAESMLPLLICLQVQSLGIGILEMEVAQLTKTQLILSRIQVYLMFT